MKNLELLFQTTDEVSKTEGLEWYRLANAFCRRLSEEFGLSLPVVCGIVSALSPQTNWEQNKKDAYNLMRVNASSGQIRNFKFTTYGHNVRKAWDICRGYRDPFTAFNPKTGAKTYNFFHNLLNPENEQFVTVDRHSFTIVTGKKYQKQLTKKKYERISDSYKHHAEKLNLIPNQLQAVLWVSYRRSLEIDLKHKPIEVPF